MGIVAVWGTASPEDTLIVVGTGEAVIVIIAMIVVAAVGGMRTTVVDKGINMTVAGVMVVGACVHAREADLEVSVKAEVVAMM